MEVEKMIDELRNLFYESEQYLELIEMEQHLISCLNAKDPVMLEKMDFGKQNTVNIEEILDDKITNLLEKINIVERLTKNQDTLSDLESENNELVHKLNSTLDKILTYSDIELVKLRSMKQNASFQKK